MAEVEQRLAKAVSGLVIGNVAPEECGQRIAGEPVTGSQGEVGEECLSFPSRQSDAATTGRARGESTQEVDCELHLVALPLLAPSYISAVPGRQPNPRANL